MVKIVECPRDAWQGLPGLIAPKVKAAYLQALADAGFRHIDAVSFVSPSAVPQMADSEEVLKLFRPPEDMEIIGIVANVQGAERAIGTGAVQTLGFPYSISPQFLERNQHQTPDEALRVLGEISKMADRNGVGFVVYISMAFGNPYGDVWHSELVREARTRLTDAGVMTISLADTVGTASPEVIAETVAEAINGHADIEIGVHLHTRNGGTSAWIRAAYVAGCRRFDAAIGGLGGCPFAQDELVGNIPTETLISVLRELGAKLPELQPLDALLTKNAEIARGSVSAAR